MTWIPRPADDQLQTLLASDAQVICVHGLGGVGCSAMVARALSGHVHQRIDLHGASKPSEVRKRLRGARRGFVWLDQVHHPKAARAAIMALVAEGACRVVLAARSPLGVAQEVCVPVSFFDAADTERLLQGELRRLGVPPSPDTAAIATLIDGWPLAVRATALAIRALGHKTVTRSDVLESALDAPCRAALEAMWRGTTTQGKDLLATLSVVDATIEANDAVRHAGASLGALNNLMDQGVVIAHGTSVRLAIPVAAFVRGRITKPQLLRARQRYTELVLRDAERAKERFRADPLASSQTLETHSKALLGMTYGSDATTAVRAALALEPLLTGRLERNFVLGLWERARAAANRLDASSRAHVAMAHARTLIARGDHESAEAILLGTSELGKDPQTATYRAIYLGHIAAWRGALPEARALLDEADARMAAPKARMPAERRRDLREDARLQRIFVAMQANDLDETERLCRQAAEEAAQRPSPRMVALARRFSAEVLIRRGAAARAVPLLERTRDELASYGDRAGALFLWSRLVEALRTSGQVPRAVEEARAASVVAARAGEGTLELAVLQGLDESDVSLARVAELSWHAQIRVVREQAETWLAGRAPQGPKSLLRLDPETRSAVFDGRAMSLARRPTLWRMLEALVAAHARASALSSQALFAVGWPSEHAEPASKKKRVQTAIWALRRAVLGDALGTHPHGYALSPDIRVETT